MDDGALQQRLARLERRLAVLLALVLGLSVLGALAVVIWAIPAVTPWHGAVAVAALGLLGIVVGTARRRRARA